VGQNGGTDAPSTQVVALARGFRACCPQSGRPRTAAARRFSRAHKQKRRGVSLAVCVLRRLLFRRLIIRRLIILMKPHPATVLGDHPGQPVSIRRRRCGSHSTPVAVPSPLGERSICCRRWLTGRERPGYLLAYSGILQCKKIPPHEEGKGYSCEPRTFENTYLIS